MARFELTPLVLGTVQLGQDYGFVVHETMPQTPEAMAMLDRAWAGGIRCFDTARAYGLAELRLGEWTASRGCAPSVITKIAYRSGAAGDGAGFRAELAQAKAVLGPIGALAALLHRPDDMRRPDPAAALRAARDRGDIAAWGASIYTEEEFDAALELPGIDMIEAPISVFDRRLIQGDRLARALDRRVTVVARSVFLQGVALLPAAQAPAAIPGLRRAVARFAAIAQDLGVPRGVLALAAVRALPAVRAAVVGAASLTQLGELIAWADRDVAPEAIAALNGLGRDLDARALDPRRWPIEASRSVPA